MLQLLIFHTTFKGTRDSRDDLTLDTREDVPLNWIKRAYRIYSNRRPGRLLKI